MKYACKFGRILITRLFLRRMLKYWKRRDFSKKSLLNIAVCLGTIFTHFLIYKLIKLSHGRLKERLVNRQGRLTVHLDNTMIVGQKFFKKWGKLLLIYHSIEAAKARKKRRLLTQSKPAILVSLCGKNHSK